MRPKSRRTDSVSEPIFLNVMWIPNVFWKVRFSFVDVDKLDKFGIEMWITERAVGHERIIEVLRLIRVSFQSVKLCKLGLRSPREKHEKDRDGSSSTSIAGSQGSVDAAGIPQSRTPGMEGGRRRSRIFISSFEDGSLDLSSDDVEELDGSACVLDDDGGSASSVNLDRRWGLE